MATIGRKQTMPASIRVPPTAWIPVRRPGWMRGPAVPDSLRAPRLVTERLVLRPHRLRDAAAWYSLQSDPAVVEHLDWPLRSRAASFKHLLDRTHHDRLEREGDFLALAVVREGELVGDVSLHFRETDPDRREFEVGWVLAPAAQGHGYAREAAAAMLELAFTRLAARRVTAKMATANDASRALAERLGFTEIGEGGGIREMVLDRPIGDVSDD